jgi:ubiquinone/menaquinone biosynthesis C-methylase UbiE
MDSKNLLKDSNAYYEDNDYYELFSIAEDGENKVTNYLEKISKNKNILDAGCGTGKFLHVLESNSNKYIGIDLSQDQLDKAKLKSKKENSIFIKSNLKDINIKNENIDLIVSSWVLGTIIDLNERQECLNKLKSLLSINGEIILIENDLNSEFEEIRNRTLDSRTKDYNDWILSNGFKIDKRIDTYFKFNSLSEAKKCFEVIYGEKIANKINNKLINHKIIIFKYKKLVK